MQLILNLKDINEEQPELYEEVLIFNKKVEDIEIAYYMIWNEKTLDEYYGWKIRNDVNESFEDYPFWYYLNHIKREIIKL